MKELSIEEKAKAYDEIREKARKEYSIHEANNAIGIMDALERVFPELKESEDEKIRKWLIRTLKSLNNSPVQIDGAYEMMLPAIAWLEKQGELSNKMKIQQDDIKATNEEIIMFYRWLNDNELQCQKDGYDDSSALFASIKSMFIEVFGKWITKKN